MARCVIRADGSVSGCRMSAKKPQRSSTTGFGSPCKPTVYPDTSVRARCGRRVPLYRRHEPSLCSRSASGVSLTASQKEPRRRAYWAACRSPTLDKGGFGIAARIAQETPLLTVPLRCPLMGGPHARGTRLGLRRGWSVHADWMKRQTLAPSWFC